MDTTDTDGHAGDGPSTSSTILSASTSYLCNSCQISFKTGQEQRIHMKEPWHVYNIKRRVASLPPISLAEFDEEVEKEKKAVAKEASANARGRGKGRSTVSSDDEEETSDSKDDEDISEGEADESEPISPFQCIFCNQIFESDDDGFEENLEHMLTIHGMFIPDQEMVSDMQSFVGYLATEVRVWHECLYCGATKPSTSSIQSHMRDKGHCLLNFDREPELLDFWDGDGTAALEQELSNNLNLSETEIRGASGRLIGSKHSAAAAKKASRKRALVASTASRTLPPGSEDAEPESAPPPQVSSSRQLARREEMSIAGISLQQRQALVLAEKKAQRSEAVARRAREWVYAKAANSQKFDQLDNQMKFGKQNHKLLPR
ncbi:hypothetical protein TWF281_004859 [Arthrobotrys megalospora]